MATTKSKYSLSEKLELYAKTAGSITGIELKGAANKYTSHNGNMFSILSADGVLAFRLPAKDLETFLKKYKTQLKEAYGIIQKEYAVVPDEVLNKPAELKKYLSISYDYVKTLRAKPTTKKKK